MKPLFHLKKLFVFIALAVLYSNLLGAIDTLVITNSEKILLKRHFDFFEDSTGKINLDSIIRIKKSGHFIASDKIPDKLLPGKTYWIHFIIRNDTKDIHSWMLHLQAQVSQIHQYRISSVSGNFRSDTTESIVESVNNYHKIKIICFSDIHSTSEYYIKIFQATPIEYDIINCFLSPNNSYINDFIVQSNFTGFVIGIMFLMMVYNLFMYTNKKRRVYIVYVLYILFHFVFVLHGSYLMEYVFIGQNQYSLNFLYMALSIGHIFYIWFIREYVGPENIPVKIDKFIFIPYIGLVVASNLILGYLAVANNYWFIKFYYLVPLFYASIGLFLAIMLLIYIKQTATKFVLIGTCITIVTGFTSMLFDNVDSLENNHIYNIGMLADMIFFSYAISFKQKKEEDQIRENEVQLKVLHIDVDHKHRELTQKVLLLAEQEELLTSIKGQLGDIKSESVRNTDTISKMLGNIDNHLKKNYWEDFDLYFKEIHPDFQQKLKMAYPELTQNDIRICSLLRLCLNTKEIAKITHKSTKSIEISRFRIRQKMGLNRDENLYDNLVSLD